MIDKTNVGYYATAGQFINIAMFIPIILVQTLTPILVRVKDNNPNLYENKKVQFISLLTWASIIIALIISVIANPLIKITFGERYLPAVPILQISIWKLVGMALSSASGQIIILEGIQKWTSIRNFLSCGLCILLNLLLIPQMGVIGASWASVITLLGASYMFNIVIPPYYKLMKVQTISILFGWKYCYEYLRRLTV